MLSVCKLNLWWNINVKIVYYGIHYHKMLTESPYYFWGLLFMLGNPMTISTVLLRTPPTKIASKDLILTRMSYLVATNTYYLMPIDQVF